MTRADLRHCWKMPDAREVSNRPVREGRIESRHSMRSRSHKLEAELGMHSFTVDHDTNEIKVAAVVPVTCSEAMLALRFSTLLVMCLIKILGRSALG